MSLLRLSYVIAVRRIVSNWRLEMVLFLGVVLAVTLMSSGVIFSDLLAEAALGHALNQATPEDANFQVRAFIGSEAPATVSGRTTAYRSDLRFVDQRVAAPFEPYLRDRARLLETPTFFFSGHSGLELDDDVRPRGHVQSFRGLWPDRVELVEGRWPYSGGTRARASADDELEVALDVTGSLLLQMSAGDEMEIFPAAAFSSPSSEPDSIRAKVVGVFQRLDPEDEFWYGTEDDFSFQNDRWTIVPLFTTESAILRQMVTRYPSLFLDVTWFFYLDRQSIRAADVSTIQSIADVVKHEVRANLANGSIRIKLDRVLDQYEDRLIPTRVPMFLIVFLVTLILIYYLGVVSGLMVKFRHTELAVLKSRGATTAQLGLMALVESLLLAAPAVVLGPLLATGVVRLLGIVFFGLGGDDLAGVPVSLSAQAYLLGLVGGLIAVVAFTGFTLFAARRSIVEFRQTGARPPSVPFIHRYYLDILLLIFIGVLWWEVQSRDTFLVRSLSTGELEIDYSLLLGPVLGLLAIGLIVLRLFPLAVAFASRAVEPVGPSWLVHGLRHVSRDPIAPGLLVILLMLATALGILGSTFSATLERSQRDRALYAAGADILVEHREANQPASKGRLAGLMAQVEEVAVAAKVQRTRGSLLTKGFTTDRVTVLGVDTEKFEQVAWYRPDFAGGKSLEELISLIGPVRSPLLQQSDGISLPEGTTALAMWVQPSRPDQRLFLRARVRDATGQYFDTHISDLGFRGWQRVLGHLEPLAPSGQRFRRGEQPPLLTPPFSLISFYLVRSVGSPDAGALFLGRLYAITSAGDVLLDDFQTPGGWHVLEDLSRPDVSYYGLETSQMPNPQGNGGSAVFSWTAGGTGLRGFRPGPPETPINAVVSRSLLDSAQAHLGDTLSLGLSNYTLPFKAVAVADFFPTLDPGEGAFAVVDLEAIIRAANFHSPRPIGGTNEIWIALDDRSGNNDQVANILADTDVGLREVRVASDLVVRNVDQPLVNAGWGALLVLVFLVLVLPSASGVMLFTYIDTRERQTEFALLRTLGSSTKQLNGVVWFGIGLVVACGIGVGTWVGFQTGASLLPQMEVAEGGVRVVPPMILKIDWVTLLASYLALAGVTVVTVVWLAWFSAKMELQRALRIGEG